MARRPNEIVRDSQTLAPLAGVLISVIDAATGLAATLTYDGGAPMANPTKTDDFGEYYYNATDAVYIEELRYGSRLVQKNEVIVGEPPAFIGPVGPVGPAGPIGPTGAPGSVAGVDALGLVVPLLPSPADMYASFNTGTAGNYYYEGRGDILLTDWLGQFSGSFTRSGSEGRYVDSAGLLKNASANTPRLTHDPVTLAATGLAYGPTTPNIMGFNKVLTGTDGTVPGWQFGVTNITLADNVATGLDGTTSASKITETTATGIHQVFYYGGVAVGNTIATGTGYIDQIFLKAAGRTKFLLANFSGGFPATTVDLVAHTATAGWTVEQWQNGFHRIWIARTSTATGAFNFTLNLLDASGASSYTGDGVSGVIVDQPMLEASTASTPSLPVERLTSAASARNADILTLVLPSTVSKVTYVLDDDSQQVASVSPGSYVVPNNLPRHAIKSFISVDLGTAAVTVTNVNGHAGPTVTLVKADIAGIKDADSPTFASLTTSGATQTLGAYTLRGDSTLTQFTTLGPSLPNTARGQIIGYNAAHSVTTWSNSMVIGTNAGSSATTITTSAVLCDTAGGGATLITGSNLLGNEAGNTAGTLSGCNIIGNTTNLGNGNGVRLDVLGQNAFKFNAGTDSVGIGNAVGTGVSFGSPGVINQSVLIGSQTGKNIGAATVSGLTMVGYNIQAPTTSTSNYASFADIVTYLGSTSVLKLQTPAGAKAKIMMPGLAASSSYANDAAAAAGGVAIDELYRNGSVVQVRVT